ncbi:MAG: D-sedoheptulose 7-phosphate isomerase [Deferrisomatales bacterium]
MLEARVVGGFREGARVLEAFGAQAAPSLVELAGRTARALAEGAKLLAFGNGGSAADAQHLAAELVNRFRVTRPPLGAVALTTDSSVLTSIGNDFGFDQVFEKQVLALARPGDLAVGFTTSGRSPNVLRALRAARERGCVCVGLTGAAAGELTGLCHYLFQAPSPSTPRIQECHVAWIHALCDLVDEILYPGAPP